MQQHCSTFLSIQNMYIQMSQQQLLTIFLQNLCNSDAERAQCTVGCVGMITAKMGITVQQACAGFGVGMDLVDASMKGDQAAARKVMDQVMDQVIGVIASCA